MRQWWPSASSSDSPIRAASASSSSPSRSRSSTWSTCSSAAWRLSSAPSSARGSPSRCAISSASALSASERSLLRRANCSRSTSRGAELDGERVVLGAEARQRLLEQRDRLAGRRRPPRRGGPRSRARPRRARTRSLRSRASCAAAVNVVARRRVAGAQLGRAEREQDVEPRLADGQRAPVMLGRLLVGERVGGLLARGERVRDGLLASAASAEVIGELRRVRAAGASSASPMRRCRRTRRLALWRS